MSPRSWQLRLRLPLGLLLGAATGLGLAQDASRGAQLYVQLPSAAASCVSCHGPDPTQNRNNILRAADRPATLLRTLNTVGVMGYLRDSLDDAAIADLAAYLARVAVVAAPDAPVALWPSTIEFGSLPAGSVSPVHGVSLRNLGSEALGLVRPQLLAPGFLLSDDCPASLAPGASCSLTLRASTAAPGPAVATLQLGTSAPWSPLMLGVSASVVTAATGQLSANTAQLDFGTLEAGAQRTRSITLTSHGTAPVTLGVATLTGPSRGPYQLDGGCASGTVLAPGDSCVLQVSYAPAVAGSAQATLQWRSDGVNPGTVQLEGRATAAQVVGPPPASSAPPPGASLGGGGCTIGPPDQLADVSHAVLLALAVAVLWGRRR
jgi:cytochrome c553